MIRAPGRRIAFLPAACTSWYHIRIPRYSSWIDWFATPEGGRLSRSIIASTAGALFLPVRPVCFDPADKTSSLVFRGCERTKLTLRNDLSVEKTENLRVGQSCAPIETRHGTDNWKKTVVDGTRVVRGSHARRLGVG